MEENPTFELRPPPPPDALARPAVAPWAIAGGAALLIALAFVVVLLLRRKPEPDARAARREAFRQADRALAETRPPGVREAATFASLILRRYLATVAGDPALFETHEETLARHDALARFDESARTTAAGGFARLAALKYDSHPPAGDPAGVLADARALLATLDRGFRA